ncbi:uncharacterized protein LOC116327438 [Oreochromis aureus]|uniref:uncharacterized protein LOC116327438 n=1 Tax=Oreochromis aureus TaxID=47969 RepID=UPI001953F759|nr:uncharacterized protein LOC116327438 [Oreochromis aureus]
MAAWFLIARFLLLYVLNDVDYSSAIPRATSPVQPRVWQGGRGEHDVYGNPRPFQYMRALRPTDPKIYPNVRDRVKVESPRSYQPRSNIPTHRSMETSPLQPRAHRNHLVAKPRSFDLALRIPFAHSRDGANPPRYGPSGLIIDNSFNNPADSMAMMLPSWATSSAYLFPFHVVLHATQVATNITVGINTGLRKAIWVIKESRFMCQFVQGHTPTSIIVSMIASIVMKAALGGSLHFQSQMDQKTHQGRAILKDMSALTVDTTTPR